MEICDEWRRNSSRSNEKEAPLHRIQGIFSIILLRMQNIQHSNRCPIENVKFFHSICRRFELKKHMKRTAFMISVNVSIWVFNIPSALSFFRLILVLIWSRCRNNSRLVWSLYLFLLLFFVSFRIAWTIKLCEIGKIENGSIWCRVLIALCYRFKSAESKLFGFKYNWKMIWDLLWLIELDWAL